MFDIKEISTSAATIFFVIDIIGSIPIILAVRKQANGYLPSGKVTLLASACFFAFLFIGESLFKVLNLDINAFAMAGAFLVFLVGLEMSVGISIFKNPFPELAAYVPLAFPLIAGAGSMASVMALKSQYSSINISVAIVINMLWVFIVLRNAVYLEKLLGEKGIAILRKVFGIILLALAIKLFMSSSLNFIHNFKYSSL